MKINNLPILSTHVANIALNKSIALHFLLSDPQRTNGLTEYSGESYINDKLHTAIWMIQSFTGFENEEMVRPWVKLPEWEVPENSNAGMASINEFVATIDTILREHEEIKNLWDTKDQKASSFLKKIIAQANECLWYTNQRLTAIQVLAKAGPMGQDDPMALMSAGPEMATKLSANPMVLMMGYLIIKNEVNSKRLLASKLLEIILSFLVEKAVDEGYTKPVMEPA